jgi:hypothetical protein
MIMYSGAKCTMYDDDDDDIAIKVVVIMMMIIILLILMMMISTYGDRVSLSDSKSSRYKVFLNCTLS